MDAWTLFVSLDMDGDHTVSVEDFTCWGRAGALRELCQDVDISVWLSSPAPLVSHSWRKSKFRSGNSQQVLLVAKKFTFRKKAKALQVKLVAHVCFFRDFGQL